MANQEQDCPASLVYRPDICVCGNPLESETESKVVPIPVKSTFVFYSNQLCVEESFEDYESIGLCYVYI